MIEDVRFTCRRLGHIPTIKFSNVTWTWTGPLSFICECTRCGETVEFPMAARAEDSQEVPPDGTLSEPIEGDGTGEALPPIEDSHPRQGDAT